MARQRKTLSAGSLSRNIQSRGLSAFGVSGGGGGAGAEVFSFLLMETGDVILMETNDLILTEEQ